MTSECRPISALKEGEWPFLDFALQLWNKSILSCVCCAAEELALSLSDALSGGDAQEAVELSRRLAQLSIPVIVSVNSQAYSQDSIRWEHTLHLQTDM